MNILNHKLEDIPNLKYDTMIDCECDFCHKVFQKKRTVLMISIKRNDKHLFCSHKCYGAFHQNSQNMNCLNCSKSITRTKSQIRKNVFCSRLCTKLFNKKNHPPKIKLPKLPKPPKLIKCICECEMCRSATTRTRRQLSIKYNKNGLVFCSRACRMRYQNLNNTKKYGCRRSKAETFLNNLIRLSFPNLVFTSNDRSVLPSKLELDIYFPSLKLAIELNGPVHYFPIYGENRLKTVQNKDIIKQKEIIDARINLLVIDISRLNSKKQTEKFLTEYFESHIKPLLQI